MSRIRRRVAVVAAGVSMALALVLAPQVAAGEGPQASELRPVTIAQPLGVTGPLLETYSPRTLVVAVEVDRDAARVLAYAVKDRPFVQSAEAVPIRPYEVDRPTQIEVSLLGPEVSRFTARKTVGQLCFEHGAESEPHVEGDTIRMHRDSFLVELPDVAGYDRVEVAYHQIHAGSVERRSLTTAAPVFAASRVELPDESRIEVQGPSGSGGTQFEAASTPLWPEDFSDPDIYRIYGDPAETNERVNIVIVPDGYTYAEKATMEQHAQDMVDYFRTITPYKEHDRFINYVLVYAYSVQSGADQCDCNIVRDTAMGTRFLQAVNDCGNSANRCLYYGGGCDTAGTNNIVTAELRAPAQDETIVMVNTTRYGGCGGLRSVYSAANSSATDIAVHELGHSWAGLADEYTSSTGCGSNAGEINTSRWSTNGAWPEWIADIGPPVEGAQYWSSCLYRPEPACEMRSLFQPFCAVCKQHWSLVTFGHPRVSPTAPVRGIDPPATTSAWQDIPTDFTIDTRLSQGPQITNDFNWLLRTPGTLLPQPIPGDGPMQTLTFDEVGEYELIAWVTADTNFVKPQKYGANQVQVSWTVDVTPLTSPEEISAPGAEPMTFQDPSTLTWEDGTALRAFAYNLYRGAVTDLAGGGYGQCLASDLALNEATVAADPAAGVAWFYLVAGTNPAGEGTLGSASTGAGRSASSPCAP